MKRYLIMALFLTGCGQGFHTVESDPRTISDINPEFVPYLNNYLSYKGRGLDYDIPMQFTDLDDNKVGVCVRWSDGHRQIQIDQYYWENSLDEGEKQEVINHELGHCDLNRDHDTRTANGYPISIMYPYVFSLMPSTVASYMFELFNSTSSTINTNLAVEMDDVVDTMDDVIDIEIN